MLLRDHPHIVQLLDCIISTSHIYFILELCEKTFNPRVHITCFEDVPYYLAQMLRGVAFCHEQGIWHRDIKPQNFLLQGRRLVLADFSLACFGGADRSSHSLDVFSLWYRPPEILLRLTSYNEKSDIWSLGCIFVEMLQYTPLFRGHNETDQLDRIFFLLGTPTEETWPGFSKLIDGTSLPSYRSHFQKSLVKNIDDDGYNLLSRILAVNPSSRISAAGALHHSYFDKVRSSIELEYPILPSNEHFDYVLPTSIYPSLRATRLQYALLLCRWYQLNLRTWYMTVAMIDAVLERSSDLSIDDFGLVVWASLIIAAKHHEYDFDFIPNLLRYLPTKIDIDDIQDTERMLIQILGGKFPMGIPPFCFQKEESSFFIFFANLTCQALLTMQKIPVGSTHQGFIKMAFSYAEKKSTSSEREVKVNPDEGLAAIALREFFYSESLLKDTNRQLEKKFSKVLILEE